MKNTKIYDYAQKEDYQVNSIHSMMAPIEKVEGYATISSVSSDGYVESFELENKRFVVGVKWHPELMLEDPITEGLFEEFIKECNKK